MTRVADVALAAQCGVDAVGLVFYPPSPRHVALPQAVEISRQAPLFVDVVALFVDPAPELVAAVIAQVKPDVLQFHGNETAAFCGSFDRPYIKALRVRPELVLMDQVSPYGNARGLLLDTYQAGVPGGTGQVFNWDLIPESLRSNVVLAGGLSPANVAEAIARVQPWAVDVSGGVESAKGVKDAGLIKQFVGQVRGGAEAEVKELDGHE